MLYNIEIIRAGERADVKVGFGDPAQNNDIVVEVSNTAKAKAAEVAGSVVYINGPASLPVAMVLAHAWCHLTKAIACFDPKLGKYVVAISHDPNYRVGDLI